VKGAPGKSETDEANIDHRWATRHTGTWIVSMRLIKNRVIRSAPYYRIAKWKRPIFGILRIEFCACPKSKNVELLAANHSCKMVSIQ
jgi:hypothetical protein